MLENMSDEDVKNDLFEEFLEVYVKVFNRLCEISEGYELTKDDTVEYGISESPFGKKVSKVFASSQSMTGFGAAVGKMKDMGVITNISEIEDIVANIKCEDNSWFLELLVVFDKIRESSKKIGNAQRMFMQYFFRELFNKNSDSYLDLLASVKNGYQKYYSQV